MTLDIFTFCDFAQENNGKLTVVGTFNVLQFPTLPARAQNFFIALRVSFGPEEVGEHTLTLSVKHKESGVDLLSPLELKTQSVQNDGMFSSINLPFGAPMLLFEKAGTYVCNVKIDDEIDRDLELYVVAQKPA